MINVNDNENKGQAVEPYFNQISKMSIYLNKKTAVYLYLNSKFVIVFELISRKAI